MQHNAYTFGIGQVHPVTREAMRGRRYMEVIASDARAVMLALAGQDWSMEYDMSSPRWRSGRFGGYTRVGRPVYGPGVEIVIRNREPLPPMTVEAVRWCRIDADHLEPHAAYRVTDPLQADRHDWLCHYDVAPVGEARTLVDPPDDDCDQDDRDQDDDDVPESDPTTGYVNAEGMREDPGPWESRQPDQEPEVRP